MPLLGTFGSNSIRSLTPSAGGGGASLYDFSSHTFTNAGQTGRTGPSISTVRSSYSGAAWAADSNYLDQGYFEGYQRWTVPATANYTVTVAAAGAGPQGGRGVIIRSTMSLTSGDKIDIVVGQTATRQTSGGAGGASWVVLSEVGGSLSGVAAATPLIIAGSGAGSYSGNNSSNMDGSYNTSSRSGDSSGGSGNSSGNGGGSHSSNSPYGGSGGGFNSDGGNANNCGVAYGRGWRSGLQGGDTCSSQVGGFGGGGGTHGNSGGGGGGAGYSGGGGNGHANNGGGGGASYTNTSYGTSQINVGYISQSNHGYVTIEKVA